MNTRSTHVAPLDEPTDRTGLRSTLDAWIEAETAGDAAGIGETLADDFTGVGPLGFVLTRPEWLDRHASGALLYAETRLDDVHTRDYGDHAVVTARQTGTGTYRGHPLPEALRATVVLRRETDRWRIEHVHTSFVAGTPGAPPIPGRSN